MVRIIAVLVLLIVIIDPIRFAPMAIKVILSQWILVSIPILGSLTTLIFFGFLASITLPNNQDKLCTNDLATTGAKPL